MKKRLIMLLVGVMAIGLCACGENSQTTTTSAVSSEAETITASASSEETEVAGETEGEQTSSTEITTLSVGQSLETDNFKMVVESIEILDEYSYSTGEYSSTSLYVEDGYKLLAVQGTMENTGSVVISDSSFNCTAVVNDSYTVDGYDVNLNFERDKDFELDPYTEKRFILYINIPEKLAEQFETVTFTLGYKNDMSLLTTTYNSDGTTTVDADNWFAITK